MRIQCGVKNITLVVESRLDPKATDFSQSCSGNPGEKNNLCIRTKSGWKGRFSGARTRVKKAGIKKRAVRRFSFPLLRFFFPSSSSSSSSSAIAAKNAT